MLTIQGCQNLACQGWSRRELIQAGGMGLFGVSLPRVLAAEETVAPFRNGSAKQVIFLLLFGGVFMAVGSLNWFGGRGSSF